MSRRPHITDYVCCALPMTTAHSMMSQFEVIINIDQYACFFDVIIQSLCTVTDYTSVAVNFVN